MSSRLLRLAMVALFLLSALLLDLVLAENSEPPGRLPRLRRCLALAVRELRSVREERRRVLRVPLPLSAAAGDPDAPPALDLVRTPRRRDGGPASPQVSLGGNEWADVPHTHRAGASKQPRERQRAGSRHGDDRHGARRHPSRRGARGFRRLREALPRLGRRVVARETGLARASVVRCLVPSVGSDPTAMDARFRELLAHPDHAPHPAICPCC